MTDGLLVMPVNELQLAVALMMTTLVKTREPKMVVKVVWVAVPPMVKQKMVMPTLVKMREPRMAMKVVWIAVPGAPY
jgi:putative SOS response-associated peptidase YedK